MANSSASRLTLGLAVVVLGIVFFVTEHDLKRSSLESPSVTTEEMENAVRTGTVLRQVGFLLVATMGLFFLLRRQGYLFYFTDPLSWLLMLYLTWCVASLTWSMDTVLTAKRVIVLGCCCLGALGLARQFSPCQLHILATTVLAGYVTLGIVVEIAMGAFQPWSTAYRFAGTVHPNTQGVYCAVLCLAAATALFDGRSFSRNLSALILFAAVAVLLVFTRSRTACAGLAITLAFLVLMRVRAKVRILIAVTGICILCTVLCGVELASAVWGPRPARQLATAVLLGRTEKLESLTGRIPLWRELSSYVIERPWLGYGYGTFWSPDHIRKVSTTSEWTINSAHSLYMEALLNVGLIGTGLLLTAVVVATWRLARQSLVSDGSGYAFLASLQVFGMVTGLLESGFLQPRFIPLVAASGLAHAAFCSRRPATS
ncbi:MAG: O-antigen ligase family protein [Pirellulales bacterium]|nr:O-antigen ligase family protein [Pirellulales bacterium]